MRYDLSDYEWNVFSSERARLNSASIGACSDGHLDERYSCQQQLLMIEPTQSSGRANWINRVTRLSLLLLHTSCL
jgi:hypothetical protein